MSETTIFSHRLLTIEQLPIYESEIGAYWKANCEGPSEGDADAYFDAVRTAQETDPADYWRFHDRPDEENDD